MPSTDHPSQLTHHPSQLTPQECARRVAALLAEGDLSERARARTAELTRDADLRVIPPREVLPPAEVGPRRTGTLPQAMDERLPPPGTVLTRPYKDGSAGQGTLRRIRVRGRDLPVLERGRQGRHG